MGGWRRDEKYIYFEGILIPLNIGLKDKCAKVLKYIRLGHENLGDTNISCSNKVSCNGMWVDICWEKVEHWMCNKWCCNFRSKLNVAKWLAHMVWMNCSQSETMRMSMTRQKGSQWLWRCKIWMQINFSKWQSWIWKK